MKKSWIRPTLVVMHRGTVQEAVLGACKMANQGRASGTEGNRCLGGDQCAMCSDTVGS